MSTETHTPTLEPQLCRRALEALRAGVPNRDAVRLLTPLHKRATEEFEKALRSIEEDSKARGMVITGGFGSGKSHLLEYLRHLGIESHFVCSRVTLSKETPLSDLTKVLRSAISSATLPDRVGPALAELAEGFSADKAPGWAEFFQWVHRTPELDPRFGATLTLFERLASTDEELSEKILADWQGFSMKLSELRGALKSLGSDSDYTLGRPQKNQELLRFAFLTRFFKALGYTGWVILLDEAELISRYGLRARGKAYAHLAQLLGLNEDSRIPGLLVVSAITDDYAGEVLHRRGDRLKVPDKMELAGELPAKIEDAKRGIAAIETTNLSVQVPGREQVRQTHDTLQAVYAAAYDWQPPSLADTLEYAGSTRMRQYVRAWITLWDLKRLYNYTGETVTDSVKLSYDEDKDIEQVAAEDDGPFGPD